ncbi:MAG: hypothetical protein SFT92_08670 [Rickettsiales bacterium]|nr:hypothetical protein [Rickettsiales bacterium]
MTSFAQKMAAPSADDLYLVRGGCDHSGRPAWYFVQVDSPKTQAFLRAVRSGNINLQSFGKIIDSGYGEQPPELVVEFMRKNYGYTG